MRGAQEDGSAAPARARAAAATEGEETTEAEGQEEASQPELPFIELNVGENGTDTE